MTGFFTTLFNKFSKKNKYIVECYIAEDNITSITYHGKNITSSYVRTWHDTKSKIPYKYEFRGENFQAYLNPPEIVIVYN